MRTTIHQDPFLQLNTDKRWFERGFWQCHWIDYPEAGTPPFVTAYRLRFSIEQATTVRAHVSADERYVLYLDGQAIGRGSERGSPNHWFYETYDLPLSAGEHVLVARVWALGDQAGHAQMSIQPGFLFAPEGDLAQVLGTGFAQWEAKAIDGYHFDFQPIIRWREARIRFDGTVYPWGVEQGEGDDWQPTRMLNPGAGRYINWDFHNRYLLFPASLPPMMHQPQQVGTVRLVSEIPSTIVSYIPVRAADHLSLEMGGWQMLIQGQGELTIPANTRRRVLIDLDDYYCAYPEVITTGGSGSLIRLSWAEALFMEPGSRSKGNRDEIEGKFFDGVTDEFLTDGGQQRLLTPLWWQAGRYIEVIIQTADEPITLNRFTLIETRYPMEMESRFAASDHRLTDSIPLMIRGIQMCAHETYFDCPYYEELMYAGDTRLEILTTYVMTRDDLLPRKALTMFDASRMPNGLTQSRFPSRVTQVISGFSLWWVGMVHDFALWRDDFRFWRRLMPGVRATIEAFGRWTNDEGLLHAPEGWNFTDWTAEWDGGIPPGATDGVSGTLNWHLIYTLTLAADLEKWSGEHDLASRLRRQAHSLSGRVGAMFWSEERGMFADDVHHQHFSEHTQCLALLSGMIELDRVDRVLNGLLTAPDLTRTSVYFSHYLFEVLRQYKRIDVLLDRLSLWEYMYENGFKTPIEAPEPSRSDCHGWGSHPLYHYYASILGIRPGSPGFRTIEIVPQISTLKSVSGVLVHPKGEIQAEFEQVGSRVRGKVSLPEGVSAILRVNDGIYPIDPGKSLTIRG